MGVLVKDKNWRWPAVNMVVDQVLNIVQKYHITTFPTAYILRRIALEEGLILGDFPFRGRVKEVFIRTSDGIALLTLKSGLLESELKHAFAHGLGHFFFSQGSRYLYPGNPEDRA
jgi:hypothetical protein